MGNLWLMVIVVNFNLLVRFTQGMDGLLGVAGIITNNYDMDHSLIPYV